ncbi:MAG: PucR family transcriptional regulator [Roseiflexaceae bacterium]
MVITNTTTPGSALEKGRPTTILITPFERTALAIVNRLIELLCTDIWVLDEQHIVIGSSRARDIGRQFELGDRADRQPVLHIPFSLSEHSGTVIIGTPVHGEVISPRLVDALVRMVASQTCAAERPALQSERKNAFIYQLLQGMLTDEDAILREAGLLGLDLATPRAVIVIDARDYILTSDGRQERGSDDARDQRRAHLVIGSIVGFFHLPNDTICAYIGQGEIAVLKASNTKNLLPWADPGTILDGTHATWANLAALKRAGEALLTHLQSDIGMAISIGIGRYHPGVGGIARSYQDARAALAVGRRCAGEYRVHCLNHLGTAAFVGIFDEQTKLELAAHLLSPLDHEPELLETLQVFFAQNCCPSETARRLVIHRNTLTYRLQKIALLTGLDPRRFDDATQIHLALLLRSFGTSPAEGP